MRDKRTLFELRLEGFAVLLVVRVLFLATLLFTAALCGVGVIAAEQSRRTQYERQTQHQRHNLLHSSLLKGLKLMLGIVYHLDWVTMQVWRTGSTPRLKRVRGGF